MNVRALATSFLLSVALALPGQLVLAQGSRRGGHFSGSRGGSAVARHASPGVRHASPGGRYASPGMRSAPARVTPFRSSPARVPHGAQIRSTPARGPRGGAAQWRHPRAGTGRGGYGYSYRRYPGSYRGPYSGGHSRSYYGGRYNGGYGRHYSRPYYGSHYRRYSRPYYGGYHYPYYRPYFYSSFYFGWPYYSTWPYYSAWPYYSGSYYPYYPVYDSGYSVPVASPGYYDEPSVTPLDSDRPYDPGDSGRLRLEVRPEDASVYVDDEFRGTAREVRSLTLPPGRHAIELVRPGYATERREVEIVRGEGRDLLVDLQRP